MLNISMKSYLKRSLLLLYSNFQLHVQCVKFVFIIHTLVKVENFIHQTFKMCQQKPSQVRVAAGVLQRLILRSNGKLICIKIQERVTVNEVQSVHQKGSRGGTETECHPPDVNIAGMSESESLNWELCAQWLSSRVTCDSEPQMLSTSAHCSYCKRLLASPRPTAITSNLSTFCRHKSLTDCCIS